MDAYAKACSDALAIWAGACNPRAIARALVTVTDACATQAKTSNAKDPYYAPARLILAQLSFLAGQGIGDYPAVDTDLIICRESVSAS